MASLIISIVTLAILAFYLITRKTIKPMIFTPGARGMFWAGLLVLAVYAIFWFALGIVEMSASITASFYHIIPGVGALVMLWIARKIPLESGLAVALQGLALAVYTLAAVSGTLNNRMVSAAFSGAPLILAGLLILWACDLALARKPRE
jgi:hypothetical protein